MFMLILILVASNFNSVHNIEIVGKTSFDEPLILDLKNNTSTTQDEGRIVGGLEAARGQFPFVVGLWSMNGNRPFCGGSMITSRHILTAAHCVYGKRRRYLKVVLGDHDLNKFEQGELHRQICKIKIHPYYSAHHITDDIAIIELCAPAVTFSPVIQPIALSKPQFKLRDYDAVIVAGWGTVREGGSVAKKLRYVAVNHIPSDKCLKSYPWLTDGQVCAGLLKGGKDSCQGDSGGPLWWMNPDTQRIIQVGVVSNGRGCARPNFPGVYTRVSKYFNWILNSMTMKT